MVLSAPPPASRSLPVAASSRMARSTSGSVASSVPLNRGRLRPSESMRSSARIGEIAGSTAAECAAICCCCPCGLASLMLCLVVKLPVGLFRRAYFRRRRRILALKRKAGVWGPRVAGEPSLDQYELESVRMKVEEWGIPSALPSPEAAAMEREMWARFYETGFWRSPSQREYQSKGQNGEMCIICENIVNVKGVI